MIRGKTFFPAFKEYRTFLPFRRQAQREWGGGSLPHPAGFPSLRHFLGPVIHTLLNFHPVFFREGGSGAEHPYRRSAGRQRQHDGNNGNDKRALGRTLAHGHNAHDQRDNGKKTGGDQGYPAQARKKPINARTRAIMPRTRAAVQEGEPLQQDGFWGKAGSFIIVLFLYGVVRFPFLESLCPSYWNIHLLSRCKLWHPGAPD